MPSCSYKSSCVVATLILARGLLLADPAPPAAPASGAVGSADATAAAALTTAPDFWQKSKHPTDWFSWGGDVRIREEFYHNVSEGIPSLGPSEFNLMRFRERVWMSIAPVETVSLNVRLATEPRIFDKPDDPYRLHGPQDDDLVFDNVNIKFTNLFEQPLTLIVGRQDLCFGNGWIIMEGTPRDGSRTLFFDAARMIYTAKPLQTEFNLIYVQQSAVSQNDIPSINEQDFRKYMIEQDEQAIIFYAINKTLPKTQIDGYFIYKHDEKVMANGDQGDIYAPGARVEGSIGENWKYRSEFVVELGQKNDRNLEALGSNSRLSYFFHDEYNNNLRIGYEYLSGDDGHSGTSKGYDPLWGRWPQYSELLLYSQTTGPQIAAWTNMHRPNAGWSINPTKKLEFLLDYHALFADANPGGVGRSSDGEFRGHLTTAWLKYQFNEHIQGHLMSEFFFPGNYYTTPADKTMATFMRAELLFTW